MFFLKCKIGLNFSADDSIHFLLFLLMFKIRLVYSQWSVFSKNGSNPSWNRTLSDMLERLNKDDVVHELMSNQTIFPLEVHYVHDNISYTVDFGNEIPEAAMTEKPYVGWPSPSPFGMYTLVCVGPDVPTLLKAPKYRSFLHWHVGNIQNDNTVGGETRVEYVGIVKPNYGPGKHRIVFILYRQNQDAELYYVGDVMTEDGDMDEREFFEPRVMAKENQMGKPIGVNYFWVTTAD
nr:PREDICTED: protein D1-like [Bemisia tabaci]